MNQRSPWLTSDELAAIRAEIEGLLTGPLAVDGQVLRFTEGAFDPATGVAEDAYEEVDVKLLPGSAANREGVGERYDETERVFVWLIAAGQLPEPPSLRDRLRVLGADWEIVAAAPDTLRSHWAIAARMA